MAVVPPSSAISDKAPRARRSITRRRPQAPAQRRTSTSFCWTDIPAATLSATGCISTTTTSGPILLGMDFSIAAGNRSNYPLTLLSLSSMFQMRLLNDVPDLARALRGDGSSSAFRSAINDGPALDTLRAHGYRVYATSPDYEGVALRQADVYLDPGTLNSFERALLARNGVAMVVQMLWPSFVGDQSRAKVEGAYRALEALSELPAGPRFAFVHIPIPHQPNLYGPNGEAPRRAITGVWNDGQHGRRIGCLYP